MILKYLGPATKLGQFKAWVPEKTNNFKYADIDFAYKQSSDFIRSFISFIDIPKKKYQLIDVKTVELKAGELPCLPGWHTDCSMFPSSNFDDDINILFSSGVTRTAFISQNWECNLSKIEKAPTHQKIKALVNKKILEDKIATYQIENNDIVMYTRMHVHAPMPAEMTGHRILIRITCTDLVPPNNRIINLGRK